MAFSESQSPSGTRSGMTPTAFFLRSVQSEHSLIFRPADPSGMPVEIPDSFGRLTGALDVDGYSGVSSMVHRHALLRKCELPPYIR